MKKPGLLRAAITAALPDIGRDPDKLAMWVDRGTARAPMTTQRGFAWEYELTIVAEEFPHDPAVLFFIVIEWLREQQPDVLAATNAPGLAWEADIIDATCADIKITVPLREIVTATQTAGGWQLDVVAEQVPLFPDAEALRPAAGPITSIWVRPNGSDADTHQVAPS